MYPQILGNKKQRSCLQKNPCQTYSNRSYIGVKNPCTPVQSSDIYTDPTSCKPLEGFLMYRMLTHHQNQLKQDFTLRLRWI